MTLGTSMHEPDAPRETWPFPVVAAVALLAGLGLWLGWRYARHLETWGLPRAWHAVATVGTLLLAQAAGAAWMLRARRAIR